MQERTASCLNRGLLYIASLCCKHIERLKLNAINCQKSILELAGDILQHCQPRKA